MGDGASKILATQRAIAGTLGPAQDEYRAVFGEEPPTYTGGGASLQGAQAYADSLSALIETERIGGQIAAEAPLPGTEILGAAFNIAEAAVSEVQAVQSDLLGLANSFAEDLVSAETGSLYDASLAGGAGEGSGEGEAGGLGIGALVLLGATVFVGYALFSGGEL